MTRRSKFLAVLVGLSATLSAPSASAQSFSATPVGAVILEGGVGVLQGAAREYVYDTATTKQVSKLRWEMETIGVMNAGAQYRPWTWLMLGVKGTTNLSHSGHMEDFDWDLPFCPPNGIGGTTCQSIHANTRTQNVLMLDAFVAARFLEFSGVSLSAIAGYKWDYYKWQAFNGTSNYAGVFNDGLGISYEQWWDAPYLGIGVDGRFGKLGFAGRVVGSWWTNGDDRDHHHSRSLLFTDEFQKGQFIGADLSVTYRLSDMVRFAVDYRYQRWMEVRGPTVMKDLAGGGSFLFPGEAAGASNESHAVTAGLKIDLQQSAHAADGSLKDDGAPRATARDWTGPYAGVSLGAGFSSQDWRTLGLAPAAPVTPDPSTSAASFDADGVLVSAFAGYNWQRGNWVWGFEAEAGKANLNKYTTGLPGTSTAAVLAGAPDSMVVETEWEGSLRMRAGMLIGHRLLAYGTAGLAVQQITARASCASLPFGPWCLAGDKYDPVSKLRTGYTIGAGLELAVSENWFLRTEYRFTDLGGSSYTFFANAPIDTVNGKLDTSDRRATLGIGYKF